MASATGQLSGDRVQSAPVQCQAKILNPSTKKSLMDVAINEIDDTLEAMGYLDLSPDKQYRVRRAKAELELLRQQAARYAHKIKGSHLTSLRT